MTAKRLYSKCFGLLLITAAALWIAGCGPVEPPAVTDISVEPGTDVLAGEIASLTVQATGKDLQFNWTVLRGELSPHTGPAVIYTAPDTPGPDTVSVEVTSDGVSTVRTITFNILTSIAIAPPTSTPTATPPTTETPTPTPTATSVLPTDTPMPPTDTPVPPTDTPVPPTAAPMPTPEPPTPTCLITEPADGDENLGFENDVKVTCSDVPDSLYIWILVYSFFDSNFYPKPGPIGSGSGDYRGTAYLGIEGPGPGTGIGDQYGIIVALANEAVSLELRQAAESFSGYKLRLPNGVEEMDRITVRRGH